MNIDTRDLSHEEWLEIRKKGIGGSDAGAVVGLSKYKTAFDVYLDKLGLAEFPSDNEAMRLGRDLEEYVAQRFCEATGKKVRRKNSIIYNDEYPYSFANVDRLIVGESAGLECKTASVLSLKRYKNGEYPEEYYCQCMHYMAVTGFEKWYLAVLVFQKELKIFQIERDEEEINALMQAEKDFWEDKVLKTIPPEITANDNVNALFPQADGTEVAFATDELFRQREMHKDLIDKLQKEIKTVENQIKMYLGESEYGHAPGYECTWKNATRTIVDTNELGKIMDLSKYKKTTSYRVLKIKKVEEI